MLQKENEMLRSLYNGLNDKIGKNIELMLKELGIPNK